MYCKFFLLFFITTFFIQNIRLIQEEGEEVVGCDANDDGQDGSLEVNAEVIGHV